MFSGLLQWITGRSLANDAYESAFVREVRVLRRPPHDPKMERFILICWLLIAVKHVLVIWAVWHYHMPFHQLIVNFPTWFFALIATVLYFRRSAAI